MTDSGAERAARRIGKLLTHPPSDEFLAKLAAIIREETGTQWTSVSEETAGEMTPEQFWDEWHKSNPNLPGETMHSRMCKFAAAYAKQRVEQAERERIEERAEWKKFLDAAHAARDAFESDVDALAAKVADLERERDTLQHNYDYLEAQYFGQTLKDAAEIGELKDCYEAAAEKLKEMREALEDGLKMYHAGAANRFWDEWAERIERLLADQ